MNISDSNKAIVSLILSALTFASLTVGVKYLGEQDWPSFTVTWGRFIFGFLVLGAIRFIKKQGVPRPNKPKLVFFRALSNFIAVSFFYLSIYLTSLVKANLLNMTYPIFIALFAPLFLGEKTSKKTWLAVLICFVGIMLILGFEVSEWNSGDFYGLICGVLASVSIMSLRASRIHDDSSTILFYVMLFGAVGLLAFIEVPKTLRPAELAVYFLVSAAGLLGQFFLTYSYKYVTAITGAITGSVRVLFSAIFGLLFFAEGISLDLAVGAGLIIVSIYWIQLENKKSTSKRGA